MKDPLFTKIPTSRSRIVAIMGVVIALILIAISQMFQLSFLEHAAVAALALATFSSLADAKPARRKEIAEMTPPLAAWRLPAQVAAYISLLVFLLTVVANIYMWQQSNGELSVPTRPLLLLNVAVLVVFFATATTYTTLFLTPDV